MKYLILGIIALLFLKAGWNRLQSWLATRKETPSSPTWSFDWSDTAPGKYLGELIPVDLVNWVIWGALILILGIPLLLLIARKIRGNKASTPFPWTTLIWVVGLVVVAVGITYLLQQSSGPVRFETLQAPGHTVKEWVPLGATMTVSQKRPPLGQYWRPCGRVTNPAAVLALPEVPEKYIVVTSRHNSWVQDLELHPELVKVLLAEKLTGVWVEFILTTGPSKAKTLCPNTRWGAG